MKVTTDACLFGAWVANMFRKGAGGDTEAFPVDNILDIGTGTGLLTLMLAQRLKANFEAVEVDEDASLQARENFAASPWANRLTIYNKDILHFNTRLKYDVIISNPPFYENELASGDPRKNLAMHDGLSILDLLKVIKRISGPVDPSFYCFHTSGMKRSGHCF